MEQGEVILERQGEVATLSFNRPRSRNSLSLGIWQRLPGLLAEVEVNSNVKVLVVRGTGTDAFASGADISEFEELRLEPKRAECYDEAVSEAERALASLTKPSIAMIHGPCIGGGCELAVACDLRFSDDKARFGITASRIGLVYGLVPTKRLVDLLGPAKAKRMLFTGELWSAQQALDRGLVDEVWASHDLEANTYAVAAEVAARAQFSVRAAKAIVLAVLGGEAVETDETRRLQAEGYATADYQEGVRAFLEKRPARFHHS